MQRHGYVLFDCFGLFVDDTFVDFFHRHGDADLSLKDSFCDKGDYGEITLDEVIRKMSDHFRMSKEEIIADTFAKAQINEGMIALVKSLRKHHHVALLSNCMIGSMDLFFGQSDFLALFDHVFLSCDIHRIKPNRDFFSYCLAHIGKEDTPIVFFDDNPKNVAGALASGIDAVRFVSLGQTKEELRKRGFTLGEDIEKD